MKSTDKIMSATGGVIDYQRDGEILASVAVPPGVHRVRPYLDAAPEGAAVHIGKGLVLVEAPSGYGVVPFGEGSHDTGANPDWRPLGNAEQLQRQMQLSIERLNRNSDRLERRLRAVASIERIPQAAPKEPERGEGEVVE